MNDQVAIPTALFVSSLCRKASAIFSNAVSSDPDDGFGLQTIVCPRWFQSSNIASDDCLSPMVSEQKAEIQLIVRTNCQTELRLSQRSVAAVDYRNSVHQDVALGKPVR
jgi:hypothetical protein